MNNNKRKLAGIILAGGKGKRMKLKKVNKVTLLLGNKPMILHGVSLLQKLNVSPIVVVVGHAKTSVINTLGNQVTFAEQKKRLGTAHAALCGVKKLPSYIQDVIVIQGDDSAFYTVDTINKLIKSHFESGASLTFLTIEKHDPSGLGRVVRDTKGEVISVIEEKDATPAILCIKEINPACYVFKVDFLKKYLPKIKRSTATGEYYLTSLIDIALKNSKKIKTVRGGEIPWRGVNTKEEFENAKEAFIKFMQI